MINLLKLDYINNTCLFKLVNIKNTCLFHNLLNIWFLLLEPLRMSQALTRLTSNKLAILIIIIFIFTTLLLVIILYLLLSLLFFLPYHNNLLILYIFYIKDNILNISIRLLMNWNWFFKFIFFFFFNYNNFFFRSWLKHRTRLYITILYMILTEIIFRFFNNYNFLCTFS